MNAHMPSGPDGSPPPIFSDEELRRLRAFQPTEPTPQQWAALERRIGSQLYHQRSKTSKRGWPRRVWSVIALGLLVWGFVAVVVIGVNQTPIQHQPQNRVDTTPRPELLPDSPTLTPDEEDHYPIAQAGDVRFISVESVQGASLPILPPPGCPNCPMVYAPVQP